MRVNARFVGRVIAGGILALSGVAAGASAASAGTVGSCGAEGQYATCDASASINHPASISVSVTASANQSVYVTWTDTCSQGSGAGGDSGSFTAETPVTRTIGHPYAHPDSCIVAAGAQLSDAGKSIHVVISAPAVAPPAIKGYAGKCVNDLNNSSANGTKIVLAGCNGGAAQDWTYTKDKLVHDGRCLTDPASAGNGTKLILNGCSSAKNDLWVHASNGEYALAAQGGKLCVTDPASAKADGTQLVVATCKNTASQHWTLP
jgi:Ricin-type beta-trefoil lectin domain